MSENLFGTETPAVLDGADGVDYSLGTRFVSSVSGTITAGRWRFPATSMTGVTVGVYQVSGPTLLGSKVFTSPTTGAWNEVAFDSPIPVTSGVTYAVVIWTPSHYTATTSYPWPKTSAGGNLTAGSANGWFLASAGSLVFPTSQSGNSASYFPDVVFEPAPSGVDAALAVTATLAAAASRTAAATAALAATATFAAATALTKPTSAALSVGATLTAALAGAAVSAPAPAIRTASRDRTLRTAVRGG